SPRPPLLLSPHPLSAASTPGPGGGAAGGGGGAGGNGMGGGRQRFFNRAASNRRSRRLNCADLGWCWCAAAAAAPCDLCGGNEHIIVRKEGADSSPAAPAGSSVAMATCARLRPLCPSRLPARFESSISVAFWHRFCKMKLEQLKLSEESVPIRRPVQHWRRRPAAVPAGLRAYNAFDTAAVEAELSSRAFAPTGRLLNLNSLDSFKVWVSGQGSLDKQAFADQLGTELLSSIRSGEALHRPARLLDFSILSYVDLKKYHFYYWALHARAGVPARTFACRESAAVSGGQDLSRFADRVLEFFATSGPLSVLCCPRAWTRLDGSVSSDSVQLISLAEAKQLGLPAQHCTFGYADPSTDSRAAGWPLRNLLVLLAHHWPGEECSVLAYRDRFQSGQRTCSHSRLMRVRVPDAASSAGAAFRCLGWEKSPSPGSGRAVLQPRFVDLSASLSPDRLAESAVDLNLLQLMRWRLVPELNLSSLAATPAAPPGRRHSRCNVARLLMGWGVRNITLVGQRRVSYSNPHQPGGKLKAEAAAKALIDIFPGGVMPQWRCL
uniref:ATG7_N domain-containing protein n=1 Tax=Macrostomum lignano TaxID=282301 RepID=A0A1I8JPW6_9PLAT